ncbi:MAG: BACON domain-containing protein, partial [Alistipes sp.]|nr:BACON domain-containing protein [Alistipes sp.]
MKQFFALLGTIMLLALGGCSKSEGPIDEPIIPEITLSKDSFIVGKAGATISVNVNVTTPDGKWSYTVSNAGKGWCTPSRAANSNTLKIAVSANSDEKSRETSISIMSESDNTLRKSIKIKQAGAADGLIIETKSFEINSKNQTLEIPFFANVKFDVEIEEGADWIEYIPRSTGADDDEPLKFKVSSNPDKEPREVSITITSEEPKESVTIKIKQKGKDSVANADAIPSDEVVKIYQMTTNSSIYGGPNILKNAYDGDLNTWVGATSAFPVEFTCKFKDAGRIDYVDIYPGQGEGIWGEVDVYGTEEGSEKKLIGSYDFKFSKERQRLYFTLIKPKEVTFVIRTA